jgi:hypothetical protein
MENAVKTIFQNFLINNPNDVDCSLDSGEEVDAYSVTVNSSDLEEATAFAVNFEPILSSVSTKHGKRAELEIIE